MYNNILNKSKNTSDILKCKLFGLLLLFWWLISWYRLTCIPNVKLKRWTVCKCFSTIGTHRMDDFAIMVSYVSGKWSFIHIFLTTLGPWANKIFGPPWGFKFLTTIYVGHLSSFTWKCSLTKRACQWVFLIHVSFPCETKQLLFHHFQIFGHFSPCYNF